MAMPTFDEEQGFDEEDGLPGQAHGCPVQF
jgi:hypothetical protein